MHVSSQNTKALQRSNSSQGVLAGFTRPAVKLEAPSLGVLTLEMKSHPTSRLFSPEIVGSGVASSACFGDLTVTCKRALRKLNS